MCVPPHIETAFWLLGAVHRLRQNGPWLPEGPFSMCWDSPLPMLFCVEVHPGCGTVTISAVQLVMTWECQTVLCAIGIARGGVGFKEQHEGAIVYIPNGISAHLRVQS